MVLRSVDPQTILLAISGASRDLQQRFEELVDPSEIKRLRAKLKEFRNSSIREKQSAQKKIEQAAHMLIQQGRLASATNRTDLVAA